LRITGGGKPVTRSESIARHNEKAIRELIVVVKLI
jgi:hypothetical protein